MKLKSKMKSVYDLGYDAFLQGKRSGQCPYDLDTPDYEEWMRGYLDADASAYDAFDLDEASRKLYKQEEEL